jgi:hypothetical protein
VRPAKFQVGSRKAEYPYSLLSLLGLSLIFPRGEVQIHVLVRVFLAGIHKEAFTGRAAGILVALLIAVAVRAGEEVVGPDECRKWVPGYRLEMVNVCPEAISAVHAARKSGRHAGK